MGSLRDKTALVTGSTKGIGLAIARGLLDSEASVFICARSRDEVEETVRELNENHRGRVYGAECDVRDPGRVKATFELAAGEMGGLDVLVNNAGVGSHSRVENMPHEEWQATIETNLSGVFYCSREAIPLMKRRGGGFIINIGSLAGKNAFAGGAAYCASKSGLIAFSEALMQEVRHDHIRVSYVMPGSVNTGFGRGGEQDPETTWKLLPEDIAAVVIHLLEADRRALASRVELRPSEPRK
ncbi:MAG TPA: SDR family oxidoreductase [Blastocatellia bacterium]|nr:SDR family oxidoreductase [Blastocatellia bacterium]